MKTAAFTIISHNYSAQAKTFFQSLQQHEPTWDRHVLIIDQALETSLISSDEATIFRPKDIGLPNNDLFFFQYSIVEANTAVKPWAIEHLLGLGYEAVVYLDPDIKVYSPLDELRDALKSHDIVLTPHSLQPYPDDEFPNEGTIRLSGIFNLGFAAFRAAEKSRAALRWWQTKLLHNCRIAPKEGIFVDQSWMDFAPHYFGAHSFLEPAYNVAYWNLHERQLEFGAAPRSDIPLVNKKPLRFMHFSGFDPNKPQELSKHQTRFKAGRLSKELQVLLDDYRDCLNKNGYQESIHLSEGEEPGITIPYFLRPSLFTPEFIARYEKEAPSRAELVAWVQRLFCEPDPDYAKLPLFLGRFVAARGDLKRDFVVSENGTSLDNFLIWIESCGRLEAGYDRRLPTFGWWTRGLSPIVQVQLALHRLLYNLLG